MRTLSNQLNANDWEAGTTGAKKDSNKAQPAEHPPHAGTNRIYIPPCNDTLSERSPRRAGEPKDQAEEDRHPGSGHQSHREDQQGAVEWETQADHTGRRHRAVK